jgi:anaerobic selenocysteine-containing dehydrogenase
MYVSGNNILAMYPNTAKTIEALRALDFLVVAAQTLHPTAEFADIVLPKATSLEEEELFLLPSGPVLLYSRPAHEPLGQARTEIDIAVPLLDRLEARGALLRRVLPWRTQREFNAYMLEETELDIEEVARTGYSMVPHTLGDFDRFKTPTGKIELFSETLQRLGLDPLPAYVAPERTTAPAALKEAYPLILMTGEREKSYHHSRFRDQSWATKVSPDPTLSVHPDTAADLGVFDGDWVKVETAGVDRACRLRVKITEASLPGVVSTGVGWWRPGEWENHQGILDININAALSYDGPFDPMSGSPDTRGILCRVQAEKPAASANAEEHRAESAPAVA